MRNKQRFTMDILGIVKCNNENKGHRILSERIIIYVLYGFNYVIFMFGLTGAREDVSIKNQVYVFQVAHITQLFSVT